MFAFLFVSKRYRKIALSNQKLCDNLYELAASTQIFASSSQIIWGHGYLGILSWAHNHNCAYYEDTLCTAIANGHLDIVIWTEKINFYWREYKISVYSNPLYNAIVKAIESNHLNVLKWLHQKGCIGFGLCKFPVNYIYYAARNGHLKMMIWLYNIGCTFQKDTLFAVIRIGRLDIMKWIYNIHETDPFYFCQHMHMFEDKNLITETIKYGHLHILIWLKERKYFYYDRETCDFYYSFAVEHNQPHILEWFNQLEWTSGQINKVYLIRFSISHFCFAKMDIRNTSGFSISKLQ
jgi:hypothetical protein